MSPITDLTSSGGTSDPFPPAHSDLPGQQVQNLPPRDAAGIPTGVVIIIALFDIILVLAITSGILRLCKKEDHIEGVPSYSVAISNRLFKERISFSYISRWKLRNRSKRLGSGNRSESILASCSCLNDRKL